LSEHLSVTIADRDPSSLPGEGSFDVDVTPPPAPSPLDGLKAKLVAKRNALYRDIEVPRWPALFGVRAFVRFIPLDPMYSQKVSEDFQKTKADDWQQQAAAQKLVHCCQGIYVTDISSTEVKYSLREENPDGEWTRFDADLATFLGLIDSPADHAQTNAIATCRAFYQTEGDLFAALMDLSDWSSLGSAEADRDFPTP
jgi:hypothetical protein